MNHILPEYRQNKIKRFFSNFFRKPKIIIIGIHGWFPSVRIVQSVFGERVGTSDKFCLEMEKAILSDSDADIDFIVLEGDGKVNQRVEFYLSQLEIFREKIEQADEIAVVCHSQGCLVGVSLVASMFRCGLLKRQLVGMLCMAGIAHGPVRSIKGNLVVQYVESGAARELFDFCYGGIGPNSTDEEEEAFDVELDTVKKYWADVAFILEKDVRITCVASWLDPVVPLYSALMYAFDHPNIYRAIYVDSHNFKDDFILQLVTFVIKLRNSRINDERLLVDLSESLVGNLYQGVEHSSVFEEPKVYELAYNWMKDCYTFPGTKKEFKILPFKCTDRVNPYRLTWSLRSLYASEEITNNEDLRKDLQDLKQSLIKWQPVTRQMKNIKHRVSPLKTSKL